MKQTVMIFTNSDSGLYDFRKEVLQGLIAEGYQVIVSVPQGNYKERIEKLGCVYIKTSFNRRGKNPIADMQLFLNYLKLLKTYKPDVVLTYTVKPNTYGSIACSVCRIPYIVNITGLGTTLENPGLIQKLVLGLYRISLRKAACVFFQNEYNKEFMEKNNCIHGKTRLLSGSGVNLTEHVATAYPSEQEEIRILAVMRIMRAKGIEELLDAAPIIKREFPKTVFEIAGAYEEESRKTYEPRIKDLQDKGILRYYGYREDIQQIMAKSHIILNPSYHEGMSNVLLEGAANGRVLLASNIHGCKETFIEGKTGFSFKPKDSESLKHALRHVLQLTKQERADMGSAGRKYVEQYFDRETVVNTYLEVIQEVTTQRA